MTIRRARLVVIEYIHAPNGGNLVYTIRVKNKIYHQEHLGAGGECGWNIGITGRYYVQ